MQRKKGKRSGGLRVAAGGAITLVIEAVIVVVVGVAAAWMVTKGWLTSQSVLKVGNAALVLAGLGGGVVLCKREKGMPLLWGVVAGGVLSAVCVIGGYLWCGAPGVFGLRLIMPVVGGVAGGVLTALWKR